MTGLEEIIAAMLEKNTERSETESLVQMLKSKGVIFEPRHNKYQFTEDA